MNAQGRMQKKTDTKSAEQLIYALNFIKMQAGMYPEGHAMISQGLDGVLDVLQEMFIFKPQITITVEDDALSVGEEILDEKNRNNRQFAKWMNDLFITTITLSRGLARDELLRFQRILVTKPSDILALGNVEKFFADSRLPHIKVKTLDLGHFGSVDETITDRASSIKPKAKGPDAGLVSAASAAGERVADREGPKMPRAPGPDAGYSGASGEKTADQEESKVKKQLDDRLWQKFTATLITKSTDEGEKRSQSPEYSKIDSPDLVKRLNEETINWDVFLKDYRSLIIQYLRSEDEEERPTLENIIFRIDSLVRDFHPHLRQQMLQVTEKELSALPASMIKANKINCFNYETIAGILRGASEEKRGISPSLSLLFQKLSATQDASSNGSGKAGMDGSSAGGETFASVKDIEKLIEREQYEKYVPSDYEEILRRKSAVADIDEKTRGNFIAEEHIHTLDDANLNLQTGKLLLALMDENPDEDEYREISVYMTETIPEFIMSGDFAFLISVIDTYKRHLQEKSSEKIRKMADAGMAVFRDTEILSRSLRKLFLQGISMNSLVGFVAACGPRHAPWLLDLYLGTWSPKGQAMIVEVLRHFREEATGIVFSRLSEASVPMLRKFLILLQLIGDADVIPYVRPYADHPNAAIRLEAIATLLRFKEHDAKALLQKAVLSKDRSESTPAIGLACEYKVADICVDLISRMKTGVILKKDLAYNELIIPEIVKTKDPQIIRHLEKMAGTRWSLFPGRLSRTKMALLNAIETHAPPDAVELIKICRRSRNRQIQNVCTELMKREGE
jgi:hypothetical protein